MNVINHKAFTLIELLIVMVIAAILATVTLNMNRGRIQQMQNLNERELWIDRHTHINREITNTNFFNGSKITNLQFIYTDGSNNISLSGTSTSGTSTLLDTFNFKYHTISSGSLFITKSPLQLGCQISGNNNTLFIQAKSDKLFCFELKPSLCTRSICN